MDPDGSTLGAQARPGVPAPAHAGPGSLGSRKGRKNGRKDGAQSIPATLVLRRSARLAQPESGQYIPYMVYFEQYYYFILYVSSKKRVSPKKNSNPLRLLRIEGPKLSPRSVACLRSGGDRRTAAGADRHFHAALRRQPRTSPLSAEDRARSACTSPLTARATRLSITGSVSASAFFTPGPSVEWMKSVTVGARRASQGCDESWTEERCWKKRGLRRCRPAAGARASRG